ncbi:MAG: flagellar hook-associated protein FlgK [Clostridia bacterium]|nr:flagellar hook-associated protein FlgK [Clostridia bacterium]
MSSSFYGLEIAKSGLYASQTALEVTGHNIANASTDGYTRQTLSLSSIPGKISYASTGKVSVGAGVSVDGITQIRNAFLDKQYRNENSILANWSVKSDVFYYVEDMFNESSTSGIAATLSDLYDSFEELANDASSADARTLVRQNAQTVCETIQYYAKGLTDLQQDQDDAIVSSVEEINNLISEINNLNKQIKKYEMFGEKANDLRDARNSKLDELSSLIDISYSEDSEGKVSIYMGSYKDDSTQKGDYCLLDSSTDTAYELTVSKDVDGYYGDADIYHSVYLTSKNGNTVQISGDNLDGGKMKGYFDCRDGDSTNNLGVPYLLNQLDTLARGIVSAYNSVHTQGYTIPYDSNSSQTGINFFDDQGGDLSKVNASNISLSDEIKESIYNIAASSKAVDLSATNTEEDNNEIALLLAGISEGSKLDYVGNIDDYLASIVSCVGSRADQCNEMYSSQETVVESVKNQRLSVSGVSLDEETINMISYEKSYQAASRVLTTLDDMLDVLINSTGRVGL